jgi:hypothetical protein
LSRNDDFGSDTNVGKRLAVSDVSYHKLPMATSLNRQHDQAVSPMSLGQIDLAQFLMLHPALARALNPGEK